MLFLRLMAAVSLVKGLYHWAQVCGIGARPGDGFEIAYRGLAVRNGVFRGPRSGRRGRALARGRLGRGRVARLRGLDGGGGVFFPNVFGGSVFIVSVEMTLLCIYLWLAIMSAREHPRGQ